MTIGFIGLGAMGLPMARRLAAAGHPVRAFDADPQRLAACTSGGLLASTNLDELTRNSTTVISCLPSRQAVESVYFSDTGVLQALAPTSLVLECSTIGQVLAVRLADAVQARGADFLDVPLFGAQARAESGSLFMLAGGSDRAFERARPLLQALANDWMHFGPAGSANAAKTAQNGLGLVQAFAIAIALASVENAGVDPARFVEATQRAEGMAASPLLAYLAPRMLGEELPDHPALAHIMLKDITMALEMAQHAGVDQALLLAAQATIAAIQHGVGSVDGFQALGRIARTRIR